MLDKLEQLNPECFRYDNHENNWWSFFDMSFAESINLKILRNCIQKYAVGYCDGSKVKLRPNPNAYAVNVRKRWRKILVSCRKMGVRQ